MAARKLDKASAMPGSSEGTDYEHLVGTDVMICNLQSQPAFNGVGARCVKYHPEKGRYSVRIHYTGRTLLVKPSCLQAPSSARTTDDGIEVHDICAAGRVPVGKKLFVTRDEEKFEGMAAYIRKNPEVRRVLSQRCKEGYLSKGPGAMIANIYDVNSAVPKYLSNAKKVLLSPDQTVWMSNKELKQKFGRAWTHGCGNAFGYQTEWPELVKRTALFARVLNFERWNDSMAQPGEDVEAEKDYYNRWGLHTRTASKTFKSHVSRRLAGEFTLPATPPSEFERALLSYFVSRGVYDEKCQVFARPIPFAPPLKPVGHDGALWKDHEKMDGYKACSAFYLFSFKSLPVAMEQNMDIGNAIENTGWAVLGFEQVGLWIPYMEEQLNQAADDDEKLRMFQMDKNLAPSEAALQYKGGSFNKTLPSSARLTTYDCANPNCDQSEVKVKSLGRPTTRQGPRLYQCSRCQQERYCSKACQTSDWKRHKKLCNKKKKSGKS